jgi:hypothetical protein
MAQSSGRVAPAEAGQGTNQFSAGPSGGPGGDPFVDPLIPDGATITFVRVRYGGKIDAVGLAYRYQGNTYELPMHGGDGGTEDLFNLADGQVITGMSGSYGDVVCQLMFDTNMGPSRA